MSVNHKYVCVGWVEEMGRLPFDYYTANDVYYGSSILNMIMKVK